MLEKFKQLGLSANTLAALAEKGFEEPTPIQAEVIPLLLAKSTDLVGQAQTGTGKTAAFGLPLIEKLQERSRFVQALILVPTRELALQVAEEINSLKGKKHLTIAAIYGGQSIGQQLSRLKHGVDIVVGTPGRIKDHLERKSLRLEQISYMILDEADEMLNMGFIDDVEEILRFTNKEKRMLLFSATMPPQILNLARRYMREYELIKAVKEQLTVSLTDQIYFEVNYSDKLEALCRIIDSETDFYGLVFCRTKIDVDTIAKKMIDRGYEAEALHGDISQSQRERILDKFKRKRINVLIATDVAARGIDIHNLTHVINFSLPQDPEAYVHRIGRTGRAGKEGTAITFVTPSEYRMLVRIKQITKTNIRREKLPAISDVISSKRSRIKNAILDLVKSHAGEKHSEFVQELIQDQDPQEVISALIQYTFADELDESSYGSISDVSVNLKGTTRLFVAKGKMDQITIPKLLDLIKEAVSIDTRKIRDIRIFETFSFITVPFEEAELILNAFKEKRFRKRPIIERAKERQSRPGPRR